MNRLFYGNRTPIQKLISLHALTGLQATEYTATGNPVSFTTNLAKPLTGCVVNFAPVQAGTGDPSPENVRPISGIMGLTAYRTGVNVWGEQWEIGAITDTGIIDNSLTNRRTTLFIPVTPNITYYQASPSTAYQGRIAYYNRNKECVWYSNSGVNRISKTFTTDSDTYFVRITFGSSYGTTYNNDISINYPDTDTEYHPYSGTSYPVAFPAEAGTVYGGELDLVTGVLTVTDACIASYNGETLPGKWISDRDVYAEGATPTTGAQVVYELATPITYQLTPQQITTLIGNNVLWSDANGNLEIKYLKKGE